MGADQIVRATGINRKAVEGMATRLRALRTTHVESKGKHIVVGDGAKWLCGEADETVFRDKATPRESQVEREQWAGFVMRGVPSSLVLWKAQTNLYARAWSKITHQVRLVSIIDEQARIP